MRISDWSSDVCSSDLTQGHRHAASNGMFDERDCLDGPYALGAWEDLQAEIADGAIPNYSWEQFMNDLGLNSLGQEEYEKFGKTYNRRSEEHTYELQSLMRISYAVCCRKKKKYAQHGNHNGTE